MAEDHEDPELNSSDIDRDDAVTFDGTAPVLDLEDAPGSAHDPLQNADYGDMATGFDVPAAGTDDEPSQAEIDAEKARQNFFTGSNNLHIQEVLHNLAIDGQLPASMLEGFGLAETKRGAEDDKEEAKKWNQRIASLGLYLQLQKIADAIAFVEDQIEKLGTDIEQLEDSFEELGALVDSTPDLLERMQEYHGHAGLNQLYREHYGDLDALNYSEDNLWGQLESNILRDENGNMVYMDETGRLYHLTENEDGGFDRQYYENEKTQLELYNQIYGDPPKIVANKTPFGQDVNNNHLHDINKWGIDYGNLSQREDYDAGDPENRIASVERSDENNFIACEIVEGAAETCNGARNFLGEQIDFYLDEEQKLIEELNNAKVELERLQGNPDRLSETELAEQIQRQQEKISGLEGKVASTREEIANLEQQLNDPAFFLENFGMGYSHYAPEAPLPDENIGALPGQDDSRTPSEQSGNTEHLTLTPDEAQLKIDGMKASLADKILAEHGPNISDADLAEIAEAMGVPASHLGQLETALESQGVMVMSEQEYTAAGLNHSPVVFGGGGTFNPVADADPNLPVIEDRGPISHASTVHDDPNRSELQGTFGGAAEAPQPEEPAPAQDTTPDVAVRHNPEVVQHSM